MAGQPDERLTRPAGNSATATRTRPRSVPSTPPPPPPPRAAEPTAGPTGSDFRRGRFIALRMGSVTQFRCGSIFGRNRCSPWLGAELAPTRDGEVMAAHIAAGPDALPDSQVLAPGTAQVMRRFACEQTEGRTRGDRRAGRTALPAAAGSASTHCSTSALRASHPPASTARAVAGDREVRGHCGAAGGQAAVTSTPSCPATSLGRERVPLGGRGLRSARTCHPTTLSWP